MLQGSDQFLCHFRGSAEKIQPCLPRLSSFPDGIDHHRGIRNISVLSGSHKSLSGPESDAVVDIQRLGDRLLPVNIHQNDLAADPFLRQCVCRMGSHMPCPENDDLAVVHDQPP